MGGIQSCIPNYDFFTFDPALSKNTILDPNDVRVLLATSTEKPKDEFIFLLEESWKVSPWDTIILLFYIRDRKEGKGNRFYFIEGMKWLESTHRNYISILLPLIPSYGTYKDIWLAFCETSSLDDAVSFYAKKMEDAYNNLVEAQDGMGIAKYAPRENTSLDKKYNIVCKLSRQLNITKSQYRKRYIKSLSEKYPTVERKMCRREWDSIDYSSVPPIAFRTYKNAFFYHDGIRFSEYLKQNDANGISSKNKNRTLPDIIFNYTNGRCFHSVLQKQLFLENAWNSTFQKIKDSGILNHILCVVDLSGSMQAMCGKKLTCFSIAFALAIAASSLYDSASPFFGKWINYSSQPQILSFVGEEVYQKLNTVDTELYENTFRVDRLYLRILDFSVGHNVPPNEMPKIIIVLTDECMENQYRTNRDVDLKSIIEMYSCHGYSTIPQLIFWNIANPCINEIPVCDSSLPFCKKIEGYSSKIFEDLLRGILQDPIAHLQNILHSERYSPIIQKLLKDNISE
jgi:hypothetical protein